MGVSVRLSRNARVYLPFWIAIPAYLFIGMIWLGVVIVLGACWLILAVGRGVAALVQARRQPPL